jgi:hypothetical protein
MPKVSRNIKIKINTMQKKITKLIMGSLIILSIYSCQKKNNENAIEADTTQQIKDKETRTLVRHFTLEYGGGANNNGRLDFNNATSYSPINGSAGINTFGVNGNTTLLRNVTGLAVRTSNNIMFVLCQQTAGGNWQIFVSDIGGSNTAPTVAVNNMSLFSTINGTNTLSLSDLEFRPTQGDFIVLDRTNNRILRFPATSGVVTIAGASVPYSGVIANTVGLTALIAGEPVLFGWDFALNRGLTNVCSPALILGTTLQTVGPASPCNWTGFSEGGILSTSPFSQNYIVGVYNPSASGLCTSLTNATFAYIPAGSPSWVLPLLPSTSPLRFIDFAPAR